MCEQSLVVNNPSFLTDIRRLRENLAVARLRADP
jgi:hypothetical protein